MKNKLNKKGFTLVELLAVIVVLAIIMVIATTQITGVIKKNTVDSFSSSLDVVAKAAKTAYLQYGENLTADNIAASVDYDTAQYTISLSGTDDEQKVCITSVEGGKFDNMDKNYLPDYEEKEVEENSTKAKKEFYAEGWSRNGYQTTACKEFK